ncbi:hypothetical protein WR25_00733 [Diploscapter pachys]|uniref:Uncharacterized protein n=1 Tax=Diploscapter pachys TaxID=2018661 RepID=A0A2A2LEW9_9BILA|nr:hypothetical protein WR25_00733 [Diploscapter pachys]
MEGKGGRRKRVANVEESGEKMERGEKGAGRERREREKTDTQKLQRTTTDTTRLQHSCAVRWVMQQNGGPLTRPRCMRRADAQRRAET